MPVAALTGTLSYNGYAGFDGSTRVEMRSRPILDDANRTVTCIEVVLSVTWIVQNDGGTDNDMEEIQAYLNKQGQALIFINKGLGDDLIVNAPIGGSLKDVKFGPIPGELTWKPIGDNRACEVSWEVTTYLAPVCAFTGGNSIRHDSGVMALNYESTFDISGKGYTTRTTTGYIEIAMTRFGRSLPDVADLYRNKFLLPIPNDFAREQSYTTNAAKNRLDFTIVDKQVESPNAYPLGITDIKASHRTATKLTAGKAMRYSIRIDMRVETAPNFRKVHGLRAFIDLVKNRTADIAKLPGNPLFIDSLEIDEDIYSSNCSYSAGFRLLNTVKDFSAFRHWTPLNDNWSLWQTSMQTGPHQQRGLAGLSVIPADDFIIDLCTTQAVPLPSRQNKPSYKSLIASNTLRNDKKPDPEQSWLDYDMRIDVNRDLPTTRQAVLQPPDRSYNQDNMQSTTPVNYPAGGGENDVLQVGGRPRYWVTLTGAARRVGHAISRAAIVQAGAVVPTETKTFFRQWTEGDALGQTIHCAAWSVEYVLPNSPGSGLVSKPNLTEGQ